MKEMNEARWHTFCTNQGLMGQQAEQFLTYLHLLQEWNKKINLTTLSSFSEICTHHFQDSLVLDKFTDITKLTMLADIGSGGGFPGIPLKIKYPHLSVVLIEVVGKKISFLKMVIEQLGLQHIEVVALDWRTFLRKTELPINLFCVRASVGVPELLRMFKPSSPYKDTQLVYWAPRDWEPTTLEKPYLQREEWYQLNQKKKRLLFFGLPGL